MHRPLLFRSPGTRACPEIQGGALHFYNTDSLSWETRDILEPNKGYAVQALNNTTLFVRPEEAIIETNTMLAKSYLPEDEWQIQIKARKNAYKDEANFAGIKPKAN